MQIYIFREYYYLELKSEKLRFRYVYNSSHLFIFPMYAKHRAIVYIVYYSVHGYSDFLFQENLTFVLKLL